jgi:hypothetical protein
VFYWVLSVANVPVHQIIIVGLFIQLSALLPSSLSSVPLLMRAPPVFFGLFVVTAVVVHIRLLKEPTPQSHNPRAVWRKHLYTVRLRNAFAVLPLTLY